MCDRMGRGILDTKAATVIRQLALYGIMESDALAEANCCVEKKPRHCLESLHTCESGYGSTPKDSCGGGNTIIKGVRKV